MSRKEERDELATITYLSGYPDPASERIQPLAERAKWEQESHYGAADAILAAGYRKVLTIATAKELDALPEGTEIVDRYERLTLQEDVNGYQEWHDIHNNVCSVELPVIVLSDLTATA